MFEYDIVNSTSVEVTITRVIKIGGIYKINPSEAYLGVDSGNVKVVGIVPFELDKSHQYVSHIHTENIIRDIDEYARVQLDTLGGPGNAEYEGELERLSSQPWIVYEYVYPSGEYYCVFPLEEFVEHSMMY